MSKNTEAIISFIIQQLYDMVVRLWHN